MIRHDHRLLDRADRHVARTRLHLEPPEVGEERVNDLLVCVVATKRPAVLRVERDHLIDTPFEDLIDSVPLRRTHHAGHKQN